MKVVVIAILNILIAIEAKHKSSSSDVSSGDSKQDLTAEGSSVAGSDYHDDDQDMQHIHKRGTKVSRVHFESRRWHRSCVRKASKMCTKACERAYKTVCKRRKCSKRSKRTLKKECKKSCSKNFESDRNRPSYEE
ncbi:uncharacterized protein LOC118276894 [Spodoptera frugiperda]|uniref:Uncharacterized protein LOC118276894 n=1 Tax=Spodoptera frugiperda TaxID=7108 RepID=A0A9R0EQV0_SPOFR|nr:uncharacterized protein LOC118276894 [Spodoptera frugiperda]